MVTARLIFMVSSQSGRADADTMPAAFAPFRAPGVLRAPTAEQRRPHRRLVAEALGERAHVERGHVVAPFADRVERIARDDELGKGWRRAGLARRPAHRVKPIAGMGLLSGMPWP